MKGEKFEPRFPPRKCCFITFAVVSYSAITQRYVIYFHKWRKQAHHDLYSVRSDKYSLQFSKNYWKKSIRCIKGNYFALLQNGKMAQGSATHVLYLLVVTAYCLHCSWIWAAKGKLLFCFLHSSPDEARR